MLIMVRPSILSVSIKKNLGFTIVELLVVIVVIAILAAITIVAYRGITQRAITSTIASDLEGAYKQLLLNQVDLGAFPATLAAANNGAGIKASTGTTYQYSVDNTQTPQYFCITATNTTLSYYVTNASATPVAGACPNQVAGGSSPITNLSVNPSMETNQLNWSAWPGTGGAATFQRISGSAEAGSYFGRLTWSTATTSPSGGPSFSVPATPGITYASSFWVRPSKAQIFSFQTKFVDSSNNTLTPLTNFTSVSAPAGAWTKLSGSSTAPANTVTLTSGIYASSASGTNWANGDYVDYDAAMVVTGSTFYNYADGTTSGWTWSGATNNSTSNGPPV